MTQYRVYYMKPECFSTFIHGEELPTHEKLSETHTELKTVEATSLGGVFAMMQGERWSPNGEARALILARGLAHTSMSVGDVAENMENGKMWVCARLGWRKI